MTITVQTLLDNVVYGTASGNYDGSSQDFYSDAVPAANYYGGQGSVQTLSFTVANLTAILTTQATLNDDPTLDHWFDVYALTANATSNTATNSPIGNFSWLRVAVTNFTAGNITVATATY